MKTINFIENRSEVIELLSEYLFDVDLNDQPSKTTSEAFNIIAVVDDINCLIDYIIFDPFNNLKGFRNATGWGNWEMMSKDYMTSEQKEEFQEAMNKNNYILNNYILSN